MPNPDYYSQTEGRPQTSLNLATDFIIRGLHYFSGFELRPITTLTVKYFLFKTGNTVVVIDRQQLIARSGDFNFTIFEDSVISADGTPVTIQNSNRPLNAETDFLPTVAFFEDPTITDNGNVLINFPAFGNDGSGGKGKSTVNIGGFGEEFLLKKNTNYLMCVDNSVLGSLDSDIAFQVNWHEARKSVGGN